MTPTEISEKIEVFGIEIAVSSRGDRDDYISLTDLARYKATTQTT